MPGSTFHSHMRFMHSHRSDDDSAAMGHAAFSGANSGFTTTGDSSGA